jgi:death-on-curing protein
MAERSVSAILGCWSRPWLSPQPVSTGEFLHPDLFSMAAAYLFHLCQNHPFIDGNKRVAAVCALWFLTLNGWKLNADEDEFERMVMAVARGELHKDGISRFLGDNCSPVT